MTDDTAAYAAIGRFFVSFSRLERAVGGALAAALDMDEQHGSEALLALSAFRPKLETLKAIVTSGEAKKDRSTSDVKVLDEISRISDLRNKLAHGELVITAGGEVTVAHMSSGKNTKPKPAILKTVDVLAHCNRMSEIAEHLPEMGKAYQVGFSRDFLQIAAFTGILA